MFYKEPNASKFALLHLIDYFISKGLDWIDIQIMTPHMKSLGAKEILRTTFLNKSIQTRAKKLQLF